jgi:hypothetical protein
MPLRLPAYRRSSGMAEASRAVTNADELRGAKRDLLTGKDLKPRPPGVAVYGTWCALKRPMIRMTGFL